MRSCSLFAFLVHAEVCNTIKYQAIPVHVRPHEKNSQKSRKSWMWVDEKIFHTFLFFKNLHPTQWKAYTCVLAITSLLKRMRALVFHSDTRHSRLMMEKMKTDVESTKKDLFENQDYAHCQLSSVELLEIVSRVRALQSKWASRRSATRWMGNALSVCGVSIPPWHSCNGRVRCHQSTVSARCSVFDYTPWQQLVCLHCW